MTKSADRDSRTKTRRCSIIFRPSADPSRARRGQVGKPEEMEKLGYEGTAWFKPYFKQLIWNAIWYDGNEIA